MNELPLLRLIAWTTLLHLAANVTSFIALVLFFSIGGFWGALNDSLSVLWALTMLPLVYLFFQANRSINPQLSWLSLILGIGGLLGFATLQFLLVRGIVQFEQTIKAILTLMGFIGLWLIINGLLAHCLGSLPAGLIWTMLVYGVSFLCSAIGFWLGGQNHPLTAFGFLAGFIAGTLWAAWITWLLWMGRLPQAA